MKALATPLFCALTLSQISGPQMLGVQYSKLGLGQTVSKKGPDSPFFPSGHSPPLPLVLWEETEGQSREPVLVKVTPPWSPGCFRQ